MQNEFIFILFISNEKFYEKCVDFFVAFGYNEQE